MEHLTAGVESALVHLSLPLNMEVFSLEMKQGTTPIPRMVWDLLTTRWQRTMYTRHTMMRILGAMIKYMYAYFTPVLDLDPEKGLLFRTENMWESVVLFYQNQQFGLESFMENNELNVPLFLTAMEKLSQHMVTRLNNDPGYTPTMEGGHPSARDRMVLCADSYFIYRLYLANKMSILCETPKPDDDVLFERLYALGLTSLSHMLFLYEKLRFAVEKDEDLEILTCASARYSMYVQRSEFHNMLHVVKNLLSHNKAIMDAMSEEERNVLSHDMEQEQEYITDLGMAWDSAVYNDENKLSDEERKRLIDERLMDIPRQMMANHPEAFERLRKFHETAKAPSVQSSVVIEETT